MIQSGLSVGITICFSLYIFFFIFQDLSGPFRTFQAAAGRGVAEALDQGFDVSLQLLREDHLLDALLHLTQARKARRMGQDRGKAMGEGYGKLCGALE